MAAWILAKHFKHTASGILIAEHWREEVDSIDGSRAEYEFAEYYLLRSGKDYPLTADYFIGPDEWKRAEQRIEAHLQRLESKKAQDKEIASYNAEKERWRNGFDAV